MAKHILSESALTAVREVCEKLYEKGGAAKVIDYANKLKLEFHYCKPCEAEQPILEGMSTCECAVCGSAINKDEVVLKTKKVGFEIYTCNPETGETGWDIHFIEVLGVNTVKEAREKLKTYPHFDVVILVDYRVEMEVEDYEYLEKDIHFLKR